MQQNNYDEQVPDVSAIVTVGTRTDNIADLYIAYRDGLRASGRSFEFIFVLDGDRKRCREQLLELQRSGEELTIIRLGRKFGDAAALMVGFGRSHGGTILSLPAYNQIESSEFSKLLDARDEVDLVAARRWPRRGNFFERVRRGLFHSFVRAVTGAGFRDLGCGIRVFDREVLNEISIYGDQFQYLPILAAAEGFSVKEIDTQQSSADDFRGRYRVREYLHRALDLITVVFLVRFTKKPLRLFGMIGSTVTLAGGVALTYVVVQRLFFGMPLADRPALLLSSLMVVLGLQLFALGLLGELIIFVNARRLREHKIAEIIE